MKTTVVDGVPCYQRLKKREAGSYLVVGVFIPLPLYPVLINPT